MLPSNVPRRYSCEEGHLNVVCKGTRTGGSGGWRSCCSNVPTANPTATESKNDFFSFETYRQPCSMVMLRLAQNVRKIDDACFRRMAFESRLPSHRAVPVGPFSDQ